MERVRLPTGLKLGPTILRVKNLDGMLTFYQGVLGMKVNYTGRDLADDLEYVKLGFKKRLGESDEPLLVLKNDPKATEARRNSAGLYHFAILVPDRKSLAQAYSGIERNHWQFDGFGDHLVSESLYLHDQENNGIEIYRDRPRNEWSRDNDGGVVMDTLPLDLDGILSELPKENGKNSETFPNGAIAGHIHLKVTNLERSLEFYHKKLGLDVSMNLSSMGAMFLSAGGYHHHIGLNTWHSLDGKRHEIQEAGIDAFTIEIPFDDSLFSQLESRLESSIVARTDQHELLVSDPDGISIIIRCV